MNFSMTFTGAIVSFLSFLVVQFGLPFTPDDVQQSIEAVVTVVTSVVALVGLVVTLYGRYRAGGVNWYGKRV